MDLIDWIVGAEGGIIITAGGYVYRVMKKKIDKIYELEKAIQKQVDENQDLRNEIRIRDVEIRMLREGGN